jgi:general secretion pathway protein L
MPRTIVGLDILEDTVAAVHVKSLMQGYQVINCVTVPVEEPGGIGAALAAVCEAIDPKGAACNSVIEDGHVSFRNLGMPFVDHKKIRQTLPFELETMMSSPVEKQLVDFIDVRRTSSQTDLIAAAASREYIAGLLANFTPLGVEPEVLDVRGLSLANQLILQEDTPADGLLLYLGRRKSSLVLFLDKTVVLIRQIPFRGAAAAASGDAEAQPDPAGAHAAGLQALCRTIGLTLRGFQVESGSGSRPEKVFLTGPGALVPETAELLGQGLDLPVSLLNLPETAENIQLSAGVSGRYNPVLMDNALALAVRESRKGKGFNFRREEFQVKTRLVKLKKELTQGAIYLTIIFVLLAVNWMVDYQDYRKQNALLDSRIKEVFSKTFPEVTTIVDPVQQMKTKIAELKKGAGGLPGMNMDQTVLQVLNDISSRIPGELEVLVNRMVIDVENIQMRGTTDNFNTVDSVKKGLEASDIYRDVTIASANLDPSGKGVRFEIKMDRVR